MSPKKNSADEREDCQSSEEWGQNDELTAKHYGVRPTEPDIFSNIYTTYYSVELTG